MVSNAHGRRTRRHSLSLATAVWALAAVVAGCSREVEIYEDPDAGIDLDPGIDEPDGGIPDIEDSGIDDPELAACAFRELGDCVGTNDFPCDFKGWVKRSAQQCQLATDCRSNDWLAVKMGDDGCVSSIGMVEPRDDFVACLVDIFGAARCPCVARREAYFLGLGNDGCPDQQCSEGGEFECPDGWACVEGVCVRADAGSGGEPVPTIPPAG